MDDEKLCHIFAFHLTQSGMCAYLAQSRCQGKRITTQLCPTGIGHILTLTAYGKAGKQGEEVTDGRQHYGHKQEYDASCTIALALVIASATRTTKHDIVPKEPYGKAHDSAHDAHKDDADDEQARIAVADMRKFMADDSSQFGVGKALADACMTVTV